MVRFLWPVGDLVNGVPMYTMENIASYKRSISCSAAWKAAREEIEEKGCQRK